VATHMEQQNISDLRSLAADVWANNTFGVAVSGQCGGAPLLRASPARLLSAAPALTATARVTALAAQAPTPAAWLAALALAHSAPPPPPQAHAAWWSAFWQRSYVVVEDNGDAPLARRGAQARAAAAGAGAGTSPPFAFDALSQPLVLRLDAATLLGVLPSGAPVGEWGDSSGAATQAPQQPLPQHQPTFLQAAPPLLQPGVSFPPSQAAFLAQGTLALPAAGGSTILAVFVDGGSRTTCCSGVFYAAGSCRGISTAAAPAGAATTAAAAAAATAGGPGSPPAAVHVLADWCYGTAQHSAANVLAVPTVAAVVYANSTTLPGNSSVAAYVGGCQSGFSAAIPVADSLGFFIGTRNNELARYFTGVLHEVLVYAGPLSAPEVAAASLALSEKWGIPAASGAPPCQAPLGLGEAISQKFALQRYLMAIQSRAGFPVRFNGMQFVANMPPHADARRWGILDCHQNTRLAYVPLLASGDGDLHVAWLEYMLRWVPLTRARTQRYFGHDGIFFTECKVPLGLPSSKHYDGSCTGSRASRPLGYPYWEPCYSSGNAFEYSGDGGTPEVALAALEHYYYTQDEAALARYLPLALLAAEFYTHHYPRFPNGTLRVWPTGVTEYYWCSWNASAGAPSSDCCENDLPAVAGLAQLLEQLLTTLPANATTPAQRSQWAALAAALPPLPMGLNASGARVLSPAAVLCSAGSNRVEAPELYAVHPYRRLTVGRAVAQGGVDLAPGRNAFAADSHAAVDNTDWDQGVWQAALLGLTEEARGLLAQRVLSPPAAGYRWPGFAAAYHDYAPVSELYAGAATALQYMLLQPGDDAAGTLVLLPAWPCQWSVRFKLWGPWRTSVEVTYSAPAVQGGKGVGSVVVTPASRAGAVQWAGCV
jgi:hypothetical protein